MSDDPHDSADRGFWSGDDIQAQLTARQKAAEAASRVWAVWAVVGTAVALVAIIWALAANAEPRPMPRPEPKVCDPWDATVRRLEERWQETRRGIGLSPSGVVEVYASEAGTWTVLLTLPDGRACVVAAGQGWEDAPRGDPA